MKKFIVAILAILYLGSATGTTVHLHYCMDKLVGWSLRSEKEDNCNKCGMSKDLKKKSNGCCKDEHKQVKLKTDHKATESFKVLQIDHGVQTNLYATLPSVNFSTLTQENPLAHSPPRSTSSPVYILNCSFRI